MPDLPDLVLCDSDIELLEQLARGWSTRQISDHTGKSVRCVRDEIRSLRHRLEAKTTIHAVVIAVRRGML